MCGAPENTPGRDKDHLPRLLVNSERANARFFEKAASACLVEAKRIVIQRSSLCQPTVRNEALKPTSLVNMTGVCLGASDKSVLHHDLDGELCQLKKKLSQCRALVVMEGQAAREC